jgi:hypothetical protein
VYEGFVLTAAQVQKRFAAVVEQAQKEIPGVLQLHLYAVILDSMSTSAPQIIGQAICISPHIFQVSLPMIIVNVNQDS